MNIREPTFAESNWDLLLRAIKTGRCTPIIGPGASAGILPSASEIARLWAKEYDYPFEDSSNLMRVAQFVSVIESPDIPKESLAWQLERFQPNLSDPNEPHNILANLPLPLYLTTNYDDFLAQALKQRYKDPRIEVSRWNNLLKSEEFNNYNTPSVADPMVFHLYGRINQPESLVLTEDDYLDFLISAGEDENTFPSIVQMACSTNLLLFIGYQLENWDFCVLVRTLSEYTRRSLRTQHIAVMLPPAVNSGDRFERVQNFYSSQFSNFGLKIYWGTIREFTADLSSRLETM